MGRDDHGITSTVEGLARRGVASVRKRSAVVNGYVNGYVNRHVNRYLDRYLDRYVDVVRGRRAQPARERRLRRRLATAEATITQLRERLENPPQGVDLGLSGGRTLDDLGYLFIVAYGRSGSTLLQGILNSIPGYDIHGENQAALHELFRYHATLDAARKRNTRPRELSTASSWYGIDRYDAERAVRDMRALVVRTLFRPRPDTRVVGFKEIRWMHRDWEDYLDFLTELFPGARFVINTRSHESVARSKWWAEAKDPLAEIKAYEHRLDLMAERLGDACFRVHYDDYVDDVENLAPLYGWLGERLEPDRIRAVMARKHSY